MDIIQYVFLSFNLKAKEKIILPPYKGSTLRGSFGNSLKKVVCALKNKECKECILKEKCVYSYVFETPPPSDTKIMRKYESAPHPFIIEPPETSQSVFEINSNLPFGLILIGKAIDYLPYFIYAFSEQGKVGIGKHRGKFELKNVKNGRTTIYELEEQTISKPKIKSLPLKFNFKSSFIREEIKLNFLTPTRIIRNEEPLKEINFSVLIRQLLRRISLVSYFHCGIDITGWDFKKIISEAEKVSVKESNFKWHDWERYSAKQQKRMKLGGFLGEITFEGEIAQFMPLLKIGEIIHIGKGATFGLGKYIIEKF